VGKHGSSATQTAFRPQMSAAEVHGDAVEAADRVKEPGKVAAAEEHTCTHAEKRRAAMKQALNAKKTQSRVQLNRIALKAPQERTPQELQHLVKEFLDLIPGLRSLMKGTKMDMARSMVARVRVLAPWHALCRSLTYKPVSPYCRCSRRTRW